MKAYQTPSGMVDIPYAYTFDASGLTDGNDYQRLAVHIDHNSQFVLRRVMGLNKCVNANATGKFLCRYENSSQMQQSAIRPGRILDGMVSAVSPVLPEAIYSPGSKILFDLYGVARQFVADTPNIYTSQLAFTGVRRFNADNFYTYKTKYEYRELPYVYPFQLDLTWAHWTNGTDGVPTNPRTFTVPVLEHDFELCAIGITQTNGLSAGINGFQIALWDAAKAQLFSEVPLNQAYINYNAPAQYGRPVYPVPTVVYPIKGAIRFDITSLLPFGTTGSYVIHFMGIRRVQN